MEGIELPERDFLMVRLHKRISARGIGDFWISVIFFPAILIKRDISAIWREDDPCILFSGGSSLCFPGSGSLRLGERI